MASGDHSAPSAEPSLFAWPSASSMQKGITENSAQGPQSRQSPLGHFRAGNLGIVVPFDLDDQGPPGPTLRRVTSHCPPTHEEEEGLLGQEIACPELTSLLLDQPLTPGTPEVPTSEAQSPFARPIYQFSVAVRKSHMALNNSHPTVITSQGAGAGRVSAAVNPLGSPAVQLVAARAGVILRFFYPHVCGLWLSAEVLARAASQNICTWPLQGPCFLIMG